MRKIVAVLGLVVLAGCYHATVDTGLAPAGPTHSTWAHSFVYGLVPPAAVNGAQQCPGGVARVSSQVGFVHGVIAFLTGGIYTPMQITVACAAGSAFEATDLEAAVEIAARERRDVIVRVSAE